MKVSTAIAIAAVAVAAVASLATVEAQPALIRRGMLDHRYWMTNGLIVSSCTCHAIQSTNRIALDEQATRNATTMIDVLTTMTCTCLMDEQIRMEAASRDANVGLCIIPL
ncbi:hypothetical protein SYNPS1DRAFT_32098 [Syncephalis pseudoplumigaleata]|uniref:Uncharacterized protein n=1 Tax=Syncephalis pseudoplumigaleata TaxID=1712513 RepID=A0A4P9YT64_9FUNG|nr:hypothetical protein SYNPS1DRAFT_32098 [Syncephalis pseudoplumigaleata]|eukprot:RKP22321.1 hypothetical protein SYNPS1DRAFT_32098 [Syncephalis pseudoplumigaleata]